MAKLANVVLSVTTNGDGLSASLNLNPMATNAAAPGGGLIPTALASGDNTVVVPTGATGLVLVPPTGSVVTKKLKGIGGDTGFPLNSATPSVLSLPAGTTSILINAGAAEQVGLYWF